MSIEPCFNFAMRKSARLITQWYEDRLAAAGLKIGQFSILRAVYYRKQTSNKELQNILALDQTTLSRNLKPLVRDGLLKLATDPGDQRVKIISLSAKGKAVYRKALPMWQAAQISLVEKLGDKEAKNILSLSDSFTKTLLQG